MGSTFNTHRNPALLVPGHVNDDFKSVQLLPSNRSGDSTINIPGEAEPVAAYLIDKGNETPPNGYFRPAYELIDGSLERAGRGSAEKVHGKNLGLPNSGVNDAPV